MLTAKIVDAEFRNALNVDRTAPNTHAANNPSYIFGMLSEISSGNALSPFSYQLISG